MQITPDDHDQIIHVIDPKYPSAFIIHGYMNRENLTWVWNIADILQIHTSWNICVIDWSRLAHTNVLKATRNSAYVGSIIADLLKCLSTSKVIRPEQIILIGHSVGARVAAHCSKHMNGSIGGIYGKDMIKISVIFILNVCITALDPVAPELSPTDAYYTQCIFTGFGNYRPLVGNCQANFYVNGGHDQPMCQDVQNAFCSHETSILYFGFSLDPKYKFTCKVCRVNIFNVFCLFEVQDRLGIYSQW